MPPIERKEAWAAAGVLLLLLCGLFQEALFTPRVMSQADYLLTQLPWRAAAPADAPYVPGNALLRDQSCQFLPWRAFAVDTIRGGELPLWDPYSYCGVPFVANDQSAVFYPSNGLYLLLPFHAATLLSALLRLLVAGGGMYLLLRRFDVSFGPALVASTAFMFCGSFVVWLNHPHANVTVWLPLLLLFADRQFTPGGLRNVAGLAAVVGVQFLGGHIESSLLLAVAAAVYVAGRVLVERRSGGPLRRPLAATAAGVLVGVALAAVQLLPLAEYLANSWVVAERGQAKDVIAAGDDGFWWRAVPALAMPYLYGDPVESAVDLPSAFDPRLGLRNFNERNGGYVGVPMLVLGLVGCTFVGRRRHATCFAILGAIGFALAFRVPPFYSLFLLIPGMQLTAVMLVRMQLLVALSLSVLGAFALEVLVAATPPLRPRATRGVLGALLAGAAGFAIWAVLGYLRDRPEFLRTQGWLRDPGLLPPDAAARAATTFVECGVVLLATLCIAAVLVVWGRFLGRRVWLAWAILVVADALVFAYGFNPIVPRESVFPDTTTTAFLERNLGPGRIATRHTFPGATTTRYGFRNISGYDAIEVLDYARILRAREGIPPGLLRTLGVRYVVADPALPPPAGRIVHDGATRIVELPGFVSRANVVPHAVDIGGMEPEHIAAALRDPRFDPTAMVLLDLGGAAPPAGGGGTAEIVEDGVNHVVVDVEAPAGGWLVLADTWYPGWRVEVDAEPATLRRANLAFRAVRLEPGRHRVRFAFRPLSFTLGALLSGAALLAIVAMLARGRRN